MGRGGTDHNQNALSKRKGHTVLLVNGLGQLHDQIFSKLCQLYRQLLSQSGCGTLQRN